MARDRRRRCPKCHVAAVDTRRCYGGRAGDCWPSCPDVTHTCYLCRSCGYQWPRAKDVREVEAMPDLNIRSVRPRAYRILKAAGLKIGTSRAGALPRHRAGVRSVAVLHGPRVSTTGSGSGELAAYLADAIAALRAAGWTVSDDGTIRVVPGMQP